MSCPPGIRSCCPSRDRRCRARTSGTCGRRRSTPDSWAVRSSSPGAPSSARRWGGASSARRWGAPSERRWGAPSWARTWELPSGWARRWAREWARRWAPSTRCPGNIRSASPRRGTRPPPRSCGRTSGTSWSGRSRCTRRGRSRSRPRRRAGGRRRGRTTTKRPRRRPGAGGGGGCWGHGGDGGASLLLLFLLLYCGRFRADISSRRQSFRIFVFAPITSSELTSHTSC
mmetsp:Transcript_39361/g.76852  ORF Transcript_39361/g.76852 Transcript_39361/m.76852 type:complete len:229 (+) Transcript_39361:1751-2437(+)